jgi:alkylation response protein AidB-like acyl-CoA dehydrogenase
MDLTHTDEHAAFRDELHEWLTVNAPQGSPPVDEDELHEWRLEWQRRLARAGWAGVDWPLEYGGRGASPTESAIFFEELALAGAPLPGNALGLLLAGPTIMEWGTDEQKQRYLGPILAADEVWCQGFSEPDAGSDLAAVRTFARREGDEWAISGQKVWTSYAQYSKWCMLVARTDNEVAKHRGLTYFLMDMDQPGVTVRPLRQITGEAEFNELFLDNARVPHENVLGGVGNGWKVALTTLMNERSGVGFFLQVRLRQLLEQLVGEVRERGLLADPVLADRLADAQVRAEILRLTAYRGLTSIEQRGQPGPEGSLVKWMWSDTNQLVTQLATDIVGIEGLAADSRWARELLRARANTIEGGTTEILKNIISERVLGLPKAR